MIAVWAALAAWAGKVDRVLDSADEQRPGAKVAAAHHDAKIGAKLPRRTDRRELVRGSAWTAVGRLGVLDAEVVAGARQALLAPHNAPSVRAHAAWALGELGRQRTWDEAHPLADALEEAMAGPLDPTTAEVVVEAFGKVYPPYDHTFAEDLAAAKALNALAANQTATLPAVYYIVQNRILTFEVTVQMLRDVTDKARSDRSEQTVAEAYTAEMSMVRWLASRQDQLVADFGDRRQGVRSAFDTLFGALDLQDRRLTMMLTWSLGNVAQEPAFAELAAPRLADLVGDRDPAVRTVTAWTLHRLRTATPARAAPPALLTRELDPQVLEVLAHMVTDPREMDIVQRVYGVEPKP